MLMEKCGSKIVAITDGAAGSIIATENGVSLLDCSIMWEQSFVHFVLQNSCEQLVKVHHKTISTVSFSMMTMMKCFQGILSIVWVEGECGMGEKGRTPTISFVNKTCFVMGEVHCAYSKGI